MAHFREYRFYVKSVDHRHRLKNESRLESSEDVNTTLCVMNKKIIAKVAMYQRVLVILEENEVNWIDKPAYVSTWSSITEKVAELQVHLQLKDKPTKGFARQKQHAREAMSALVSDASNLITAYAQAHDNQTLLVRHQVPISKMRVLREVELENHVERVLGDLNEYMSELADYGVTPELKDAITARFNEWMNLVKAPRKAINDRKKNGFVVQQLIKSGDALLRDTLDKLMTPFERTHPNFYFQYRSARILLETRGRNDDVAPPAADDET